MKQINKKYKNTTAVAHKLVEENVNIVYRVLHDKFRGMAFDLLISIAMTQLLDAAYNYDFNSNVKFTTYAYSSVYLKLLEMLKKEKNYTDSRILCGDFSDDAALEYEIRTMISEQSNKGAIDISYDGLQTLSDLGLYELGWEMRHQELKGGRNVKPKDYKQAIVVKREEVPHDKQ